MTKAIKASRSLGFMSPVGKNSPYAMLGIYARGQKKRRREEEEKEGRGGSAEEVGRLSLVSFL